MNLYEDLTRKITAAGFTVKAVCEKAGVSSGTPSHWAAGRTSPNQQTYDKLVAALNTMVADRDKAMSSAGIASPGMPVGTAPVWTR